MVVYNKNNLGRKIGEHHMSTCMYPCNNTITIPDKEYMLPTYIPVGQWATCMDYTLS
jgi:hypothetical protein